MIKTLRGDGGIGRHVRLRSLWRKLCRFKSCSPQYKDCCFQQSFFLKEFLMFAVFVNCGTVLIGSIFGLFFTKKINQEISENIQIAAGIITLVLGFQMAMKYHSI